jgi:hypothetical protein
MFFGFGRVSNMTTATTFPRIPFIHKAKYYSVMYQEKDAFHSAIYVPFTG